MEHTKSPIEEYIAAFPDETRTVLERLRQTIKQAMPDATEAISYGVPTFKLHDKYIVYFGGYEHHVSIYPLPSDPALRKETEPFISGKGTLKFPLGQPIPYELITRVARALLEDYKRRTDQN